MLLMALCLALSYQANVFISWSFYLPEHGLLTAQYTSHRYLGNNWPAGDQDSSVWSPGWAEEGWHGSHDLIFSTIGGNLAGLQPGSSQGLCPGPGLAWRQSEPVRDRHSALTSGSALERPAGQQELCKFWFIDVKLNWSELSCIKNAKYSLKMKIPLKVYLQVFFIRRRLYVII